jgi:uncharacterized OB-fold protein
MSQLEGAQTTQEELDLRPAPQPDEVTSFYWEAADEGRLVLQRCEACGRFQYPPELVCTYCQHQSFEHVELSGAATLYSFCLVERPFHAGFVSQVPYVLALVELVEQPGLRLLTNILEADVDQLSIGMELEVCFEKLGETHLPQFRPAKARR